MATLKVGDIVIESGNVSFNGGSDRAVPVPAARSPEPAPRRGPQVALRKIPGTPGLLAWSGGLLLVIGVISTAIGRSVFSGLPSDASALGWLLLGVPATSVGIGLLTLGGFKWFDRAPPGTALNSSTMAPDLFAARMKKLHPLLISDRASVTIELLIAETGMTEAALVETLILAESRDLVDEELNVDTGEWYYRLSRRGKREMAPLAAPSLEERKRAIKAHDEEKSR